MLQNPFCKCLYPKRITNPYTHESMVVPCGHCEACTLAKNSRYAFQCDLESYVSKHTLFITLTYANRFIPRATIVDSLERPFGNDLVDKETGEILGASDLSSTDIDRLLNKFYLFGDVPYLRKTDLQLFFKRFRYYVSKKLPCEKVRYFAVGEYGPVHFRPHYHILLFLQSDEALSVCSEALSQAWSFGRIDCQVSKGKCSSYVASYVNSSCTIPKVFKIRSVSPFCVHSQKLGQKFLVCEREKIYSLTPECFIKRSIVLNGKYKEFDLWRSYYSYFYPKCKGFATKSSRERAYSYSIYDTARSLFPEASTTLSLAKEIAVYIHDFHSTKSTYLIDLFGACSEQSKLFELADYFCDYENISCPVDSVDFDLFVHRIYSELLVSKHFLYFVCTHNTLAERKIKLRLIEDFYFRLEYIHLTDFFESQRLFFESDLIGDVDLLTDEWENTYYPYFYYNVHTDFNSFRETPVYKLYSSEIKKLFNDRIKHKKLNDLNKIFFDN